jgi:hypothetical protein
MTKPPDYRDVVHPRRKETRVLVVAGQPPCIHLRDEAAKPRGRDYRTASLGDLASVEVPPRWVLAVLLCPGDSTAPVVAWLQRAGGDPSRVLFVLHPRADPVEALRAWYEAGFPDPVAVEASTLAGFAKALGRFVNDWIYTDATGRGWPL